MNEELNEIENKTNDEEVKLEEKKITKKTLQEANETLKKYKEGKANLEQKVIDNEQWWKLRHWEVMRRKATAKGDPQPASGWLFNVIISKHADATSGYPSANILPREEDDKEEAKRLSSIIPVVLKHNDFEKTYSDVAWYKMRQGTGVYSVLWDSSKLNGLGDITIKKVDLLNLFWEPGITDIQKSKNVFHCELVDNKTLENKYPELKGKLENSIELSKYMYDDEVDTKDKSVVVDWYYKVETNKKTILHYCKYVGDNVLFASENETEPLYEIKPDPETGEPIKVLKEKPPMSERGWYDHGKYPFVFDSLFPMEGTPCGFGYIDLCKNAQESIDLMNSSIEKNTLLASKPRFFIQGEGAVNEDEYSDWNKDFVHVDGNLGEDSVRQIQINPLPGIYVSVLNNKIEELKETSGNRDVNNGGTSGATAYSAIVAMQEQSGKTSADSIRTSYQAFEDLVYIVIELIRQFYTMPRQFRIIGKQGEYEFLTYSNEKIAMQKTDDGFGHETGVRLPVFDIEVEAQKKSRYTQLAQNELILQLYNQGFFNPQMVDQALLCLEFMDFDRKEQLISKISEQGTLYEKFIFCQQQMLQLAEMVDRAEGSHIADELSMQIMGAAAQPIPQGTGEVNLTQTEDIGKNKLTQTLRDKAENTAKEATQPK